MNGKFKVWDSELKEFWDIVDNRFSIKQDGSLYDGECLAWAKYTVVFHTGQTDEDGVELYDGDILNRTQSEYHISTNIREVVYHDGCWRLKNKHWKKSIPMPILSKREIQLRTNIRIGNKFENPELLEK